MNRRPSKQRGQIIFLMMFLFIPLVLFVGYILNAGAVSASRAKLQNAVDSSVMTEAAWVARSLNVMTQNNTAITQSVVVGTAAFALEGPIHFSSAQAGEVAGHYMGRAAWLIEKAIAAGGPVGAAFSIITAAYYALLYLELNDLVLRPLKDLHDQLQKAVFDGYCLLGSCEHDAGLARAAYAFGQMNTLIFEKGAKVIEQATAAQAQYNGVDGAFRRYSGWGWDTDPASYRELKIPVVKQSLTDAMERGLGGGGFNLGNIMASTESVRNILNIRSTGEKGTHENIANIEFDYFSNFDNHGYEKGSGPYIDPNGGENALVKEFKEIRDNLEKLSHGTLNVDPITKAFEMMDMSPPSCGFPEILVTAPYCVMKELFDLALNTLVRPFTDTETPIPEPDLAERIENVWKWASLWRDIPYSAEFDDSMEYTVPAIDFRIAGPPRFFWKFPKGIGRGYSAPSGGGMDSALGDLQSAADNAVNDVAGDVYDAAKEDCETRGMQELRSDIYPPIEARGALPEDDPQYLTGDQVDNRKESALNAMKARCQREAEAKRDSAASQVQSTQGVNSGEAEELKDAFGRAPSGNKNPAQLSNENKAQAAKGNDYWDYILWRPEWFYQAIVKNSIPFSIGDTIEGFGSVADKVLGFSMFEIDLYAVRQPRLMPELGDSMRALGGGVIPTSVANSVPTVGPTREKWSIAHLATGESGAPIFSSGFPGAMPNTSVISQAEIFNAQWYDLYTQHWRAKHTPVSLISCSDCGPDRDRMRGLFDGEQSAAVLQNFLKGSSGGQYDNLATH